MSENSHELQWGNPAAAGKQPEAAQIPASVRNVPDLGSLAASAGAPPQPGNTDLMLLPRAPLRGVLR